MKLITTKVANLVATLITLGSLTGGANAAITAYFEEIGNDVVFTASGSVDLTGLSFNSTNDPVNTAFAFAGFGAYGAAGGIPDGYVGGSLSVSGSWPATTELAAPLTIDGNSSLFVSSSSEIHFPTGYVSNSDINSLFTGARITNSSFISLNLTEGAAATYSWNSGANGIQSVSFIVGSPIPEPSSALLVGLSTLSFVFCRRRTN